MQQEAGLQYAGRDTRSINLTDSSFVGRPAAETSPLLSSRRSKTRSFSSTASGTLSGHSYHFDLDNEKKRCKKMFYNRVPKGKAAFSVFLVNFLESFAFYGALNLVRFAVFNEMEDGGAKSDLTFTIFYFTIGRLFYPVAGLIADVYLGRYRVIHGGLWLLWVGFAVMLVGMACQLKYASLRSIPAIVATGFFVLGSASVESTIIPFGVDQIQQGASSDELSSYFPWYYFGRNAGYVINSLCLLAISFLQSGINSWIGLSDLTQSNISVVRRVEETITYEVSGVIMIVAVTAAIFIVFCLQHWFFRARHRDNPLRTIINVVYFAATVKRHAPIYRRSFRYGEERKPRIELAKVEFDGIYSAEEVEDVKTFFRILFFILSLGFTFATFGAVSLICLA